MADLVGLRDKLKNDFFEYIDKHPDQKRWVLCPETSKPIRQPQPPGQRAKRAKYETGQVIQESNGTWVFRREDGVKEIVFTENIVDRVYEELARYKNSALDDYKAAVATQYEGILIEDLDLICKKLNEIRRRSSASTSSGSRASSPSPTKFSPAPRAPFVQTSHSDQTNGPPSPNSSYTPYDISFRSETSPSTTPSEGSSFHNSHEGKKRDSTPYLEPSASPGPGRVKIEFQNGNDPLLSDLKLTDPFNQNQQDRNSRLGEQESSLSRQAPIAPLDILVSAALQMGSLPTVETNPFVGNSDLDRSEQDGTDLNSLSVKNGAVDPSERRFNRSTSVESFEIEPKPGSTMTPTKPIKKLKLSFLKPSNSISDQQLAQTPLKAEFAPSFLKRSLRYSDQRLDENLEEDRITLLSRLATILTEPSVTHGQSLVQLNPMVQPDSIPTPLKNDRTMHANRQQERLLGCDRVKELVAMYRKIDATGSKSHLNKNGKLAYEIIENGRPAACWLPGDKPSLQAEADYLLLNEQEHLHMSKLGPILKPVVVRDENFRMRRSGVSRDKMFEKLLKARPHKQIAVQMLNTLEGESPVRAIPVHEAIKAWKASPQEFSDQNPPMNMLDLSNTRDTPVLTGIQQEYDVLTEVCAYSDEDMLFHLKSYDNAEQKGVGKQTVEFWTASDLKSCIKFQILAQKGAVSAWHMDNCGVWTWVTLEGNSNDINEKDEDVLKFWPLFPLDKLPKEDRAGHLRQFEKLGTDWRPKINCKFPILSLIRGDTLIMPPGTIHAPITVTDCLFSGGMCMHPKAIKRSIAVWHYLHRDSMATNEPAPKQTRAIIDYINDLVHEDPQKYGFETSELTRFDQHCNVIADYALSCRCAGGCKTTKCNCLKYGQRCGLKCHGEGECQNHFGCDATRKVARAL